MKPISRLAAFSRRHAEAPDPTDLELAARILAGDTALFELIMRRYNRLLYRLARAIAQDDDEARDVVQVAYIRAYYHLDQFRGPYAMKSWLGRIVVNEANGRRRRAPRFVEDEHVLDGLAAEEGFDPESSLIDEQGCCIVQRAIERLPEEFRTVFMLRGVEQLSVAETAAVLDLKEATVRSRFHRARAQLKASLGRRYRNDVQQAFRFDGSRCDEVVAAVLSQLRPTR